MANYELFKSIESDHNPELVFNNKTFIDINYDAKEITKTDEMDGEKKSYKAFTYSSVRVRDGLPTKDSLIQFLIHTEYSLDDEVALINNKETNADEYNAYITRRNELKALAKELFEQYETSK